MTPLGVWWHDVVLRHKVQQRRVNGAMFDPPSARGVLYRCVTGGCGKVWAR